MKQKRLRALIGGMLLGASLWLPAQVSAEVVTIEADGEYQMGDGMAENQNIAKERARAEAMRAASEQVAVYVESETSTSMGTLKKDDIQLLSFAVLQVKDVKFTPVVMGESIKFKCHIKATVDTDEVRKKMQEDNQQLKTALRKSQDENDRLRKEMEELKQQYQKASTEQKKEIDAKVKQNDIDFEANKYYEQGVSFSDKFMCDRALESFSKALLIKPDYAKAYNMMGSVYAGNNQPKQALICYEKERLCYEKELILRPNDAELYSNLSYSYFLSDISSHTDSDGMIHSDSEKPSKYMEKAIQYMEKAVMLDSGKEDYWKQLGQYYVGTHQDEKAIEAYKKVLDINPRSINAYLEIGDIYYYKNKEKAIEWYDKAENLGTITASDFKSIGGTYSVHSMHEKAIECFNKAIGLDPNDRDVYGYLAGQYSSLKKHQKAIDCYRKLISIKKPIGDKYYRNINGIFKLVDADLGASEAYSAMGDEYLALNNTQQAIECYENALRIYNEDQEIHYKLGNTYAQIKQEQKAIECYKKAVAIDPKYDDAYFQMGYTYGELGQNEKAIECYEKTVSINPNSSGAYNNMGVAYDALGQTQKAIQCYEKAIETGPNEPLYYNNLGKLYNRIGQKEKGDQYLKKARSLEEKQKNK